VAGTTHMPPSPCCHAYEMMFSIIPLDTPTFATDNLANFTQGLTVGGVNQGLIGLPAGT